MVKLIIAGPWFFLSFYADFRFLDSHLKELCKVIYRSFILQIVNEIAKSKNSLVVLLIQKIFLGIFFSINNYIKQYMTKFMPCESSTVLKDSFKVCPYLFQGNLSLIRG